MASRILHFRQIFKTGEGSEYQKWIRFYFRNCFPAHRQIPKLNGVLKSMKPIKNEDFIKTVVRNIN